MLARRLKARPSRHFALAQPEPEHHHGQPRRTTRHSLWPFCNANLSSTAWIFIMSLERDRETAYVWPYPIPVFKLVVLTFPQSIHACDRCRKRKAKCDPGLPALLQKRKLETVTHFCRYSFVSRLSGCWRDLRIHRCANQADYPEVSDY